MIWICVSVEDITLVSKIFYNNNARVRCGKVCKTTCFGKTATVAKPGLKLTILQPFKNYISYIAAFQQEASLENR